MLPHFVSASPQSRSSPHLTPLVPPFSLVGAACHRITAGGRDVQREVASVRACHIVPVLRARHPACCGRGQHTGAPPACPLPQLPPTLAQMSLVDLSAGSHMSSPGSCPLRSPERQRELRRTATACRMPSCSSSADPAGTPSLTFALVAGSWRRRTRLCWGASRSKSMRPRGAPPSCWRNTTGRR
ncbi:hypothetical protein FKM82_011849 [Ascaphus truei]